MEDQRRRWGGCDSDNLNAAIMPVIRTDGEDRSRGAEARTGSREEAKVNETWQGVTEAYRNRRLETERLKVQKYLLSMAQYSARIQVFQAPPLAFETFENKLLRIRGLESSALEERG